jgi:hypothetical protein
LFEDSNIVENEKHYKIKDEENISSIDIKNILNNSSIIE